MILLKVQLGEQLDLLSLQWVRGTYRNISETPVKFIIKKSHLSMGTNFLIGTETEVSLKNKRVYVGGQNYISRSG